MPRDRSRRKSPRPKTQHFPRTRKNKRRNGTKSSRLEEDKELNSRQKEAVRRLLSGIGVPEPRPFVPDAFQLEALAAIETEDVLVTAPTGSGKTWIAREEIRRILSSGRRAWYTTPLKALSNSKYTEFSDEFGSENVGILTGDRKENSDAPLIVGTTEIYRNQLFDAMREGFDVRADFVILDEAHYLGDEIRGHVWEEAIILTPARIRLLLLSATVGGANDFADWISVVRGTKVRVVTAGPRPVELRAAFLSPDLHLYPLFNENDNFNSDIDRFTKKDKRAFKSRRQR